MADKPLKALLDRKLDLSCWRGALVATGDWLSDGRVMFSLCAVVGPYIERAEKMGQIMARDDRIRGQEEADRLMEAIENTPMATAVELGWQRKRIPYGQKKSTVLDVMYVEQGSTRLPLLADYVRMLKSLVDYDEVRISDRLDRPAGFYRRGELVAICTPLAIS